MLETFTGLLAYSDDREDEKLVSTASSNCISEEHVLIVTVGRVL